MFKQLALVAVAAALSATISTADAQILWNGTQLTGIAQSELAGSLSTPVSAVILPDSGAR